jgi:hypothetical protein
MTKKVLLYFALLLWFVVPTVAQPTIFVESKEIVESEYFYTDVKAINFPSTVGFQFSVRWDSTKIKIDSLEVEGMTDLPEYMVGSNFNNNYLEAQYVGTTWIDPDLYGIQFSDTTTLFRIYFNNLSNPGDTTSISIADDPVTKEFIDENSEIFNPTVENGTVIVLNPTGIENMDSTPTQLFTLSQNEPNPFKRQTLIPFEVFQSLELNLEIYNTKGEIVYSERSIYPPGKHTISMTAEQLSASGIYYYKLKSKDFFITNRMILVR